MAYIKISAYELTQFIRSYHSDMIGQPGWGDGTSTNISSNEFWRVAESVWGLTANKGYLQNSREFDFKIIDARKVKQTGLHRFGKLYERSVKPTSSWTISDVIRGNLYDD